MTFKSDVLAWQMKGVAVCDVNFKTNNLERNSIYI